MLPAGKTQMEEIMSSIPSGATTLLIVKSSPVCSFKAIIVCVYCRYSPVHWTRRSYYGIMWTESCCTSLSSNIQFVWCFTAVKIQPVSMAFCKLMQTQKVFSMH